MVLNRSAHQEKYPALFSMKIHHAGKFKELEKMRYVNGLVAYVDGFDIEQFSVHELNVVMEELGYVNDDPIYYHYMIPGTDLDIGLRALGNDLDVLGLAKYIKDNKLIMVYCEHIDTKPLLANANTTQNETMKSIVQELLSMDYEFDPFEDNMTASMNDQPSVNEQEKYRDDNYEPVETLVEGETLAEDDDSNTKEGDNAEVEWVRHSNCGQQQDHEPIPGELDVIGNDYFDSGTDSEDDGIEKIRRNKLKEIKKANESADNIVFKHFFYVGQTFSTPAEVKERVRLHSIETRRKLFLAKNDKLRIRVKCLGKIHVFTLDGEGPSNTKEVAPKKKTTKVKGKKDVGPSDPVRPNKKGVSLGGRGMPKPLAANEYSWALQIYKVKNTETWEVKTYTNEHKCLQSREIHACTSKFLSKAFKAKSAALNQVKGDYSQQYTMLRDYCLELRRENHDTTIKIEVERDSDTDLQTRVFKRIYICLGPLKKGFKACGRDLLGLDGTFMKGPYPGQLLTTMGLDGNNGIYPLAYAIVEKETTYRRYCLRPVYENMKKRWNGQAYNELLWRCVATTTIPYFNRATEELKQFNKQAFEWLAKIPAHSCRAKSDILNNLCECFNGKILDARDAPIITPLEYIREYLMRRMVNVIAVINKTDGPLTPSTTKLLKVAMDKANKYTVGFNGGKSMRKWELTSIPCAHAIATNYNMALNGIQVMWKKSQIPTTLTLPKHHTPVGRPRKIKRKTKEGNTQMVKDGKMSRAYKTVTCTKFGNRGHNSRSCKGQMDPMNETGTSTSQRSTNAVADTRKRPSDAGNTPANKKQSTTSSNAGTTP
ncbi:hypothetical protein Tco_1410591 [Tanacetum coccineum]